MAAVPPTAAAAAGPIAAAAPSTTAAASPGAAGANKRAAIDISGDDDSIPSPSPAPKAAKTAGAKTVEPTSVVPYYYGAWWQCPARSEISRLDKVHVYIR